MKYTTQQISFPDRRKGFVCPNCNSFCKEYARSFNSNMGVALMALYKNKIIGFVKMEDFLLSHGYKRCGDFSYLVHYKLLEKLKGKREDNSKKNGYYKITGLGIMFCELKYKVREKFVIYQDKFLGFEGEEIDMKQALGNKFSYSDLMSPNGTKD